MTSTRPYLLRAFLDWILDNELTPYIVVDAHYPNVMVPEGYINSDGKIVFNVSPAVVQAFNISNHVIEFDARFSGSLKHIYAPIKSVVAIHAKENGRGMIFDMEEDDDDGGDTTPPAEPNDPGNPPKRGKPNLKVVK